MRLDAGDNDLDRLLSCLGQAILQAGRVTPTNRDNPGLVAALPAVTEQPAALMEAIAATPLPFMLILDEFEHLHNPAALSMVQQLIEALGPQQKIVISSREHPELSIGRLRACQQLLQIDAAQLRFTPEETSHFLLAKRKLRLDTPDVQKLHEVTGGWAAALWLSSLALEGSEEPGRIIQSFSGSNMALASYLAEDVLSRKPKHLQDFILQTSILRKFCGESCNAVTGRDDARELLQEIARSNMFVTALDEQHLWFSYHPLFAEFLRIQLDTKHPGLARILHGRAAHWYVEQGQSVAAIEHAIASGEQELVVQLLVKYAEGLFMQGRVRLLARWLDTLDRTRLATNPKLMIFYTGALIHTNRSAEALQLLETVIQEGVSSISRPAYLGLKALSLIMLDRLEETAAMWDDPGMVASAVEEPLLHTILMIGGAYYYATADRYKDARLLLDQATREHLAVGPLFSLTAAGYLHGMLDLMQGKLCAAGVRLRSLVGSPKANARSATLYRHASLDSDPDSQALRHGADSGFASIYLAEVLYEMDALEEAKLLLKLHLPRVKDAGIPDQLIASHLVYARILRAEGHGTEGLQTLLELERLGMQRRLPRMVDMARLEQAREAVLIGDLEAAKGLLALVGNTPAWQGELQLIATDIESPFLGMTRLQVHCGQAALALPTLKAHLQKVQGRGRLRYALRMKILQALALANAGQRNPALRTIQQALQDALPEGFVRAFKDEGPAVLALIRDMLEGSRDLASNENASLRFFAERILGQSEIAPLHGAKEVVHGMRITDSIAGNELTSRELDVLILLAQGYGNQVIAEKLFVSVTTVKTHLRNINIKLGSHTRTEAISIARRLSIIS
ncbi:LuxR C-terminal-related transcriptional regulator [Noviherbaspirillum massiliense]|uniref:LuxR C-terminal-related transcriptional regulator n=1 Tax=Noviherbaspirillum massiliense TaxID=1465823 RepID=UPI0024788B1B|nr:LuxR C-terminal-related transcriptional regulator [Noviherbaspirillum massiliense]